MLGVFQGGSLLAFATAREHNLPGADGMTLGFVNTISVASGAIFQPLVGWILDLNWDGRMEAGVHIYSADAYRTAFLAIIAGTTAALVMGFLVRETFCRQVREAD